MCGIAGFISKTWGQTDLIRMSDRLIHRGPDGGGHYFDPLKGIGLAHRRLSILDLSTAGSQPFYSRDGRFAMVYNGEVYNYREVASKYKITTISSCDTEVIIEAFALAGIESIVELNGMFAMAIWDRREEKLYLIRDRLGIKPLYYYSAPHQLAFASELKALSCLPVRLQRDPVSISNFLCLGYIPGDATIYKDCRKLRPGQYAVVDAENVHTAYYWKMDDHIEPDALTDADLAKTRLKALLTSSVSYNMISDVPLGVLLSGGVDSSLIAAIAQSVSDRKVKTFSIGFKEKKYNESEYARAVSGYIGSDHHEYTVTEKDALDLVDTIMDVYDEPYADSSAIPTMMVSALARKEVTVALSGDGGDELFMGYGFYYWARRLSHPLARAFRRPLAAALHTFGDNRLKRGSYLFNYPSRSRIKTHIFSQEQYLFSEREVSQLLVQPVPIDVEEGLDTAIRRFSWPEAQSFFDIKHYLPEELLVKVDRASMHHSLEVRVPFLDHRVVEFALNLSPNLKLKGDTGKYILKEVLYDYIPPAYFNRPKWGFAIPLQLWLKSDLKYLVDDYLRKEVVEAVGLVHYTVVDGLKRGYFSGSDYLYNRLWALILLHKWMTEKAL